MGFETQKRKKHVFSFFGRDEKQHVERSSKRASAWNGIIKFTRIFWTVRNCKWSWHPAIYIQHAASNLEYIGLYQWSRNTEKGDLSKAPTESSLIFRRALKCPALACYKKKSINNASFDSHVFTRRSKSERVFEKGVFSLKGPWSRCQTT